MDNKMPRPSTKIIAHNKNGTDIILGYVEYLKRLEPRDSVLNSQGMDYEIYEELLRDDQIIATLNQRSSALTSKPTQVMPASDSKNDIAAAKLIEDTLEHIRWDTVTKKMLRADFLWLLSCRVRLGDRWQ